MAGFDSRWGLPSLLRKTTNGFGQESIVKRFGLVALLLLSNCSSAKTAENCDSLQQSCLDKGMCLVSTDMGMTGGSAQGSYGAGGVGAGGSASDSASCGFTCSQCGDGGAGSANNGSTNNYNCQTGAVCGNGNSVGGNTNGGSSSGSNPNGGSVSQDGGYIAPSSINDSGFSYGPWSSCFNPGDAFPTGVLKYPNCTAYCQSIGKSLSGSCQGPSFVNDTGFQSQNVLVWCGFSAGACGDISQYPDYIPQCYVPNQPFPAVCVVGLGDNGTYGTTPYWAIHSGCNNATGIPTSAQCCCN